MQVTKEGADEGAGCEEQGLHGSKAGSEVEYEYAKTCKEQEKRYAQHRRQCLNQPRKAQIALPGAKRRARPGQIARVRPGPCEYPGIVLVGPPLQQRGEHDARQTDGHAQKPERVDQYDRVLRRELARVDERRRRVEFARRPLVVHDEQFVSLHEIERPLVERVELEASNGCANECRNCGRE